MSKFPKLTLTIILFSILLATILLSQKMPVTSLKSIGPKASVTGSVFNVSTTSSPIPCYGENGEKPTGGEEQRSLYYSFQKVDNDPTAVKIIKKDCLMIFGSLYADLEHTGFQDLVFWGSDQWCGSCHGQSVYVISGETGLVVFSKDSQDPRVDITKDKEGDELDITEPLRGRNEGLCCPTWGVKITYAWYKYSGTFFAIDSQPYKY